MMKVKKWMSLALAGVLALSLAACSGGNAVYVQSVSQLMGMGGIAPGDRFAGVVVSEHVAEIQKDSDKSVKEVFVKEGDDVKEGQKLFAYDTEELQLTLDKQKLELEQLKASVENYNEQIKQLEKEQKRVHGTDKLQYTIQIQSTQVDLKEAELKIKTKENEVKKSESILENAEVTSPVDGRVQAINENGTDQMGNPLPYITIQKSGAYRVKGIIGELQRGAVTEGSRLKIQSRTVESDVWYGTVSLVDYENPIQDNNMGGMMSGSDQSEMTSASKYPFYIDLESTEGLLLGQHVYLQLDTGDGDRPAVSVGAAFLMMEEDGSAHVWLEKGGKLHKQAVTLGEYDPMTDSYAVTDGLTTEDYIAFPDDNFCHEGAPTTHDITQAATEAPQEGDMGSGNMPVDSGMDSGMEDMGMDSGMEDMGMDSGMEDMGMDSGMEDMGMDSGAEALPPETEASGAEQPVQPGTEDAPSEPGAQELPQETEPAQEESGALRPDETPIAGVPGLGKVEV